jgi:Fic family protein/DNA-binding XRE family transcriptional regulator
MKTLLKNAREAKGFKTREVAQILGIDQALISKFESGNRKPTKDQVIKLASLLEIDFETIMIAWLKEKILHEIGQDEFALQALMAAEEELRFQSKPSNPKLSSKLHKLLAEIDTLKARLDSLNQDDNYQITQDLELEYTFESNRLEGNTLTLRETTLVINEGLTIAGKSMREHLEAVNHQEAIAFIKDLALKSTSINERDILAIHNLILRGIHPEDAGKYRKVIVKVEDNTNFSPQSKLITKEMDELFIWFETNKSKLHPIVLAAEIHERLVTIYPFIDGNGKTSRLIMNLILLQNGYTIANIKGDSNSKMEYHQSLEITQTKKVKEDFVLIIARTEKESLERYINKISH